jgi:hypothetical protein
MEADTMKPYGPSVYYASDKIIKDALCQTKVSLHEIVRLFRKRGIVVSPSTPREDLAIYFSRLSYDYYDQERISDALGINKRRDRTTSRVLIGVTSLDDLERSAKGMRQAIESLGDKIEISLGNGRLTLHLEYTHVDYRRSEFTQVRHESGEIEFLLVARGSLVRSTQNSYVNQVLDQIIDSLEKREAKTADVETINLAGITDPRDRSKFFDLASEKMDGFNLENVVAAYVYRSYPSDTPALLLDDGSREDVPQGAEQDESNASKDIDDGDDIDDIDDIDDGDDVDDQDDVDDEDDETIGDARIDKATLRGRKVQNAEELRQLYARGFYCFRRTWVVIDKERNRYTLDASFLSPADCTGFSYLLRKVTEHVGDGRPPRARKASQGEIDRIYSALESSARAAISTLTAAEK